MWVQTRELREASRTADGHGSSAEIGHPVRSAARPTETDVIESGIEDVLAVTGGAHPHEMHCRLVRLPVGDVFSHRRKVRATCGDDALVEGRSVGPRMAEVGAWFSAHDDSVFDRSTVESSVQTKRLSIAFGPLRVVKAEEALLVIRHGTLHRKRLDCAKGEGYEEGDGKWLCDY